MSDSSPSYLAFDLGASSGRAILGTLRGDKMDLLEVHRFPTPVIETSQGLYWDIDAMWDELQRGLELALAEATAIRSLSVDSWAVDYVPLDSSLKPLRNPYCYRDTRTDGMMDAVFETIPARRLYELTGIQFMQFNTIYQVYADKVHEPDIRAKTATRLLIADYFNYMFSGRPCVELSNASTTQLVDARTRQWSWEIMDSLGLGRAGWPSIVESGTRIGHGVASRGIEVVAGCSHDTACAVAAVPAGAGSWAYLSSGTWSLIGIESPVPIITDRAFDESYTNEIGLGPTVRFLKNINGLWLLEECMREWNDAGRQIAYEDLMREARDATSSGRVIDLSERAFMERGSMPTKIRAYCRNERMDVGPERGDLVRLILDSLAASYADKLATLGKLTGREFEKLHVVGGGSKNELLCQLTADECDIEVVAGPAEATALGNLLVQAMAMGDLTGGRTIRGVARASSSLRSYRPARVRHA